MDFQKIKDRLDIVDVVSYYGVELRRFSARCPFHEEKTPSFKVSPSKQIFKCFGCGAGGDVITFTAKYHNISLCEAAKMLNRDFGLGLNDGDMDGKSYAAIQLKREEIRRKQRFLAWADTAYILLCEYLHKLQTELGKRQNRITDKYVQTAWRALVIEHYLDVLSEGSDQDRIRFYQECRKEVREIERCIEVSRHRRDRAV